MSQCTVAILVGFSIVLGDILSLQTNSLVFGSVRSSHKFVKYNSSTILMSLSHIVGLITGGASGLGAGTAHRLLQRGAKIIIADVSSERYSGPAECFVTTDVTSEEQVDAALQVVEDLFGEPGR
jgi:short chain dehydrogenase